MFFQFSSPPSARSLTKACSLFWNSFTELAATTSYGSKLYTFINPKADRRRSSEQFVCCTSSNCLWCRFATLRVQYATVASIFLLEKSSEMLQALIKHCLVHQAKHRYVPSCTEQSQVPEVQGFFFCAPHCAQKLVLQFV